MSEPEIYLSNLFSENNMKMQSSTVYKALRGEGMRVTPLVREKSNVRSESHKFMLPRDMVSSLKPKSPDAPAARQSAVRNIIDLRTDADKPMSAKLVMEFKKPEVPVTPVSAASQRVPYRSTKLEKQVSRESLKDDESERKLKLNKKLVPSKVAGRKIPSTVKDPLHRNKFADVKPRISTNLPQRNMRRKKVGETNAVKRETVYATSTNPETLSQVAERIVSKERVHSGKKVKPSTAPSRPPPSANKPLKSLTKGKLQSLQKKPSMIEQKTVSSKIHGLGKIQTSLAEMKTKRTRKFAKKPWLPTSDPFESWNQYCPANIVKANAPKKRKPVIKKSVPFDEDDEAESGSYAGLHTNDDAESDNTEVDEEERKRLRESEIMDEMLQKSTEFFNQFKYGEILRKSIPKIRYNSEIPVEKKSRKRLTDVEVKIRLGQLDESTSKIIELMTKWSSMLITTREESKVANIEKTLINAQRILDGKVDRAKEMLIKYLYMCNADDLSPPTDEMDDIQHHIELVQLDMNSLERMFAAHEKKLSEELDEPTSTST